MSITTNGKISRLYKIKDFCIVGDGAHTSIKRQSSGIMYLTSKNFKPSGLELSIVDFISESDYIKYFGSSKKALITPLEGDVLFGIIGSLGVPYIVKNNDNFGISSSVAIIRPQQGLISKYLYYFMISSVFQGAIEAIKSGVAQSFLSLEMIRSLPLIVPNNLEQERIAAILSAYDDLIENNDRRIALLEKMAEEIYREWFVRLRFPGHEQATFHKGIPEGWGMAKLENIASFLMGQSPKSEFYNNLGDGLPFHQGVGTYGSRFPRREVYCSVKGRLANKGDILFSVRAPVGRLNIADCEMVIGRGLASIRHKAEYNSYLFYFLKNTFSDEDIIGNGSIFNSVGKDELLSFQILNPSNLIIKKFNIIAEKIDLQIEKLYKTVDALKQTRDRLLTRLISGTLSVEDLDIQFPPSMIEDTTPTK